MDVHNTINAVIFKIFDLMDVPLAFIGSMYLMSYHEIMGDIAITLTVFYTGWKWAKEVKEARNKKG